MSKTEAREGLAETTKRYLKIMDDSTLAGDHKNNAANAAKDAFCEVHTNRGNFLNRLDAHLSLGCSLQQAKAQARAACPRPIFHI